MCAHSTYLCDGDTVRHPCATTLPRPFAIRNLKSRGAPCCTRPCWQHVHGHSAAGALPGCSWGGRRCLAVGAASQRCGWLAPNAVFLRGDMSLGQYNLLKPVGAFLWFHGAALCRRPPPQEAAVMHCMSRVLRRVIRSCKQQPLCPVTCRAAALWGGRCQTRWMLHLGRHAHLARRRSSRVVAVWVRAGVHAGHAHNTRPSQGCAPLST